MTRYPTHEAREQQYHGEPLPHKPDPGLSDGFRIGLEYFEDDHDAPIQYQAKQKRLRPVYYRGFDGFVLSFRSYFLRKRTSRPAL
jgi:hypothetical protein